HWARGRSSAEEPTVARTWLADRFVAMYWPITVRHRLRQATDPSRNPRVMRLIRELCDEHKLGPEARLQSVRQAHPARYQSLVNQVSAESFDDVLPRFHTVRRSEVTPRIYNLTGPLLVLTADGIEVLSKFGEIIDLLAIGAWVRFTEQYTSAPRLFEKIEGS